MSRAEFMAQAISACAEELDGFAVCRADRVYDKCESPIERLFAVALWVLWDLEPNLRSQLNVVRQGDLSYAIENMPVFGAVLCPQYRIDGYRLDFYFASRIWDDVLWEACIECDGHDFHERTKKQAARDKKRDRVISASGMHVFRFTGSEIFNDAMGCAREIVSAHEAAFARLKIAAPVE